MRRALAIVVVACGLAPALARAEGSACAIDDAACACAETHDCWAFERIYSGREAALGLRATLTSAPFAGAAPVEGGLLTGYATERYVTLDHVTGHVALSAAVGGGSAGTEGALSGDLGFGLRSSASHISGAFVRGGVSGLLVGNGRFALSYFEPIQLKAGFQVLDAELLVEGGLSAGFVGTGRYAPPGGAADNLGRALEVGSFFVAHAGALSFTTRFIYLPASVATEAAALTLSRADLCGHLGSTVVCGGMLYANRGAGGEAREQERPSVLYAGLTLGLTP